MLYFAYGSNLNIQQMKFRCRNAIPFKGIAIGKFKLVFRYFADIQKGNDNDIIYGGLWKISPECEISLDKYEGVEQNLYKKLWFNYKGEKVLFYKMSDYDIMSPKEQYIKIIEDGYDDFQLPKDFLYEAVSHSLENEIKYLELKKEELNG